MVQNAGMPAKSGDHVRQLLLKTYGYEEQARMTCMTTLGQQRAIEFTRMAHEFHSLIRQRREQLTTLGLLTQEAEEELQREQAQGEVLIEIGRRLFAGDATPDEKVMFGKWLANIEPNASMWREPRSTTIQ